MARSSKGQSIMVGNPWQEECEVADHIGSVVRKQTEECWGSAHLFTHSLRALANGIVPLTFNPGLLASAKPLWKPLNVLIDSSKCVSPRCVQIPPTG